MDLLIDPASWDLVFHNGPLTKEYTTQPDTQVVSQLLKTLDKVFPNSKDNHFGVNYLVLDENLPVGVKTRDYLEIIKWMLML